MAVFASDLRTRTLLRVFPLPGGGSVAVDHPLWLIGRETLFITALDKRRGPWVSHFEGVSTCYDRAGDAVEDVRQGISNAYREGMRIS